jgi:hypothetical protein
MAGAVMHISAESERFFCICVTFFDLQEELLFPRTSQQINVRHYRDMFTLRIDRRYTEMPRSSDGRCYVFAGDHPGISNFYSGIVTQS